MSAMLVKQGQGLARTVLGIVALAAALGLGSVEEAASAETGAATGAACSAATELAPISGDDWATSKGYPGEPY